ncbi:MAG: hemolysin family protein [Alphaproteobacteria bacterium]
MTAQPRQQIPDATEDPATETAESKPWFRGMWHRLRRRRARNGERPLEELILDRSEMEMPLDPDQRVLLENVLQLRNVAISDIMVPRVDIVAVDANAELKEVVDIMGQNAHSRLPVYRGSLDEVIGIVHIKDVLACWGEEKQFKLSRIVRRALFVAPTMRVLDLLLQMRAARIHMAFVVDEYGGVDGLVTIEDLVEEIVGEIEDEHDIEAPPMLVPLHDGSLLADARVELETFEEDTGLPPLADKDEDIDTLGGLVFYLAGRVPARGEIIRHPSGIEFEILEADARRIRRIRIRNLPASPADG